MAAEEGEQNGCQPRAEGRLCQSTSVLLAAMRPLLAGYLGAMPELSVLWSEQHSKVLPRFPEWAALKA